MNTTKNVIPIIFLTLLLDITGISMIIPVIPSIFTDTTSASFLLTGFSTQSTYIIAGLVTAVYGMMTFIASPILGELSDHLGRKKLLMVGIALLAVSQFVFGFGIITGSLTIIFISRAIGGLAGGNISIAQAAIADITEPKDRAKNFGLIGAALGLGFIIGPALGGFLVHYTGNPSVPFFFAGVLGIVNFLSAYFFLPETKIIPPTNHYRFTPFKALHNIKIALTDKEASSAYTASFLYLAGFTFFTTFTSIYLVEKFKLNEAAVGTYFGVIGVWIVITQGFILRLVTKKYNERQILRYSLVCVAITIALMPFMPTMFYIYALLPLIAIPQGLSMANMSALISRSVSPARQGAALGINGSLTALAQGIVPAIAGGVTAYLGLGSPFLLAGLLILLAWRTLFFSKLTPAVPQPSSSH